MTFELERDPRKEFETTKVTVRLYENAINKGRVVLSLTVDGKGYNAALSEREVDDLIVALEYYKSLAREK